jgi:hypothetical protein
MHLQALILLPFILLWGIIAGIWDTFRGKDPTPEMNEAIGKDAADTWYGFTGRISTRHQDFQRWLERDRAQTAKRSLTHRLSG